ncbi:MAG: STAS domain-containing protein [Bacilli bacterium]|nr:STAS domain-containing protein [Bacilli bacterium]
MLDIHIGFKRGILFIKLIGDLNKSTVLKLNEEVTSLIEENQIRNVVFNVSKLKTIDDNGIGSLLINYEISKKNEGLSLLCGINKNIYGKISDSNLLKYMYETSNELDAIRLLEGYNG